MAFQGWIVESHPLHLEHVWPSSFLAFPGGLDRKSSGTDNIRTFLSSLWTISMLYAGVRYVHIPDGGLLEQRRMPYLIYQQEQQEGG